MPRTFAETLAADPAFTFLDPNGFGQQWVHIRDGKAEAFIGVLDEHEPKPSDNGQHGETVQRAGLLTCPLSIEVNCEKGRAGSRFQRNGEEWFAVGLSADDQLQEVLVVCHQLSTVKGGFAGNRQ